MTTETKKRNENLSFHLLLFLFLVLISEVLLVYTTYRLIKSNSDINCLPSCTENEIWEVINKEKFSDLIKEKVYNILLEERKIKSRQELSLKSKLNVESTIRRTTRENQKFNPWDSNEPWDIPIFSDDEQLPPLNQQLGPNVRNGRKKRDNQKFNPWDYEESWDIPIFPDREEFTEQPDSSDCPCSSCAPGPPGPPGQSGSPGLPGPPGLSGSPGQSGPPGLSGPPGRPGNSGKDGIPGLPGVKGDRGLPGLDGPRGFPGSKGDRGLPGLDGAKGPPGSKGDRGLPGLDGANGPKGSQGDRGLPGLEGAKGVKGPQGSQGDRGLPGLDGPKGFPGSKGNPGLPGSDGAKGPPGSKGDRGLPGFDGPRGPPGSKGEDSSSGVPRGAGSQGIPGLPGLNGKDGQPGAPGKKGDRGLSGLDGAKGLPGTKGEPGGPGLPGPKGLQGPACGNSSTNNTNDTELVIEVHPYGNEVYSVFVPKSKGKVIDSIFGPDTSELYKRFAMPDLSLNDDTELLWKTADTDRYTLLEYKDIDSFKNNDSSKTYELLQEFDEGSKVIYDKQLYYKSTSGYPAIIKYSLENNSEQKLIIPGLTRRNLKHLYDDNSTYFDFNVDENGLWVIFAVPNINNIGILKINTDELTIENSWNITLNHNAFSKMFIDSGILYSVQNSKIAYSCKLYTKECVTTDLNLKDWPDLLPAASRKMWYNHSLNIQVVGQRLGI